MRSHDREVISSLLSQIRTDKSTYSKTVCMNLYRLKRFQIISENVDSLKTNTDNVCRLLDVECMHVCVL